MPKRFILFQAIFYYFSMKINVYNQKDCIYNILKLNTFSKKSSCCERFVFAEKCLSISWQYATLIKTIIIRIQDITPFGSTFLAVFMANLVVQLKQLVH